MTTKTESSERHPYHADTCSPEEWQTRVQLAACYRLVAHFGWDDLIFTHLSARVPGRDDHFLINPFGLLFHEITASSLVKVDHEGQIIDDTGFEINPAGFTIHSAVHMAKPLAGCVMHLHTNAGCAVSAQKNGLLPLTQTAMLVYSRLAYHDYEGVALDLDERERLVKDLGEKDTMILRNHGTLTMGQTVPEAFILMYFLERACQAQVAAQTGHDFHIPSETAIETTKAQSAKMLTSMGNVAWPGLLRLLDVQDPSYRD